MRERITAACLAVMVIACPVFGHEQETHALSLEQTESTWTAARPDGHAPIGVMGDHVHKEGEWMFSYRYMSMEMGGVRDGEHSLSNTEIYDRGYMVAPQSMQMQMHMLGAMHAVTDDLTLMLMVPYVRKDMELRMKNGREFSTRSEGLGDLSLTGLFVVTRTESQLVHLDLGLSLPTGSVDERDGTPMGPGQKLPYGMQPGSGTYDLMPGLTYLGQCDSLSWGSQLKGVFRLGRNSEDYSLGDRGILTAWVANAWTDWLSTSFRLDGQTWSDIDGQDDELNPKMTPAADAELSSGSRVDAWAGINLYAPKGVLKGHRLAIEAGMPVYQKLDGPQMETDWMLVVGWQYAF